jgi:osmoprotectant transport system substrate-binding protein
VLLADVYGAALKAKGVTVTQKPKIGAREVYIPALKDGSIDLIPEYSGTLLAYFDKSSPAASSEDIYKALPAAIGPDLKVLDQSKAQDKDSIAVTANTASKFNLKSIGDLKDKAGDLTLGAAAEFKTRPDGPAGLKAKYGVVFGTFKTLDPGGPLSVGSLKNGQVDAADLFTTDPAITANKFVVLADPLNLYTAQNVLPLISAKKASPTVTAALNAVSAKLDTATLIELNTKVASGTDPDKVAQDWVKAQGLS